MESPFQEKYKKAQVPGNYQKKRLDRTYQIASSAFDVFPPQNSALQKYIQSDIDEKAEIEMELTNLLFKSHYFDLSFQTPRPQNKQSTTKRSSLNYSSTTGSLNKTRNNQSTSLYHFFKEYSSSFMNNPTNTEPNKFKYSTSKY